MQPPNTGAGTSTPANSPADSRQMALEELKQLQAIIGRYDEHMFKIRNWATAIGGAIVIARLTYHINPWVLIIFAFIAMVVILYVDLLHRSPQRLAINRVKVIEKYLREPASVYDGPRIGESLSKGWVHVWTPFKEFWKSWHFISYLILFILVVVMVVGSSYRDSAANNVRIKIEKTDKDTKTEVDFDLDASPQDQQKLLEKARNNLGAP